jgi:hypothetical protein
MTLDTSENTWPAPWHSFKPPHKIKKKKGVKIDRTPTRNDDERLLCWLQMRDAGMTSRQIGEAWGVTKNSVIGALNRIAKEEVE